MSKLLEGLNPQQAKVASHIEGGLQVDATAGSGKTHTIVRRVAIMLENGIDPSNILMTTFTKKAAEEMETRLSRFLNKDTLDRMTVCTTHSLCFQLLKQELKTVNHPSAVAFAMRDGIVMGWRQRKIIDEAKKALLSKASIPYNVKVAIRDMPTPKAISLIGFQKNTGTDVGDYVYNTQVNPEATDGELALAELYTVYEEVKMKEGLLDFDDLMLLTLSLLREHKHILEKYQDKFKYIIVDEAQDNNILQYELMSLLGYPENNLCFVGDCDQSMYSFRGARPDAFISLKASFKNMITIPLEDNYRSNPHILEAANRIIVNNVERLDKKLKAHKVDNSESVFFSAYSNEVEEAEGVANEIELLVNQDKIPYNKIAILYRTNAISQSIEDQLIIRGLPYTIHGGISFYQRKEIKDIISYLNLAYYPSDNSSFERIYGVPKRYLGKAFLQKLQAVDGAHINKLKKGQITLKNYETKGVDNIIKHMNALNDMIDAENTPSEMLDYILSDDGVGYSSYLEEEDDGEDADNVRLENIGTLKFLLNRYKTLEEFLNHVDDMTAKAKLTEKGVQLMTIHRSKGLEFPVVFGMGWAQGKLPHSRALDQGLQSKNVEEERRLAYVLVTRAESILYLSYAASVQGALFKPSMFLQEMGDIITRKESKEDDTDDIQSRV